MAKVFPTRVAQYPATMLASFKFDDTLRAASGQTPIKTGSMAYTVGVLPAGARIVDAALYIDTGFNDTTTNTIPVSLGLPNEVTGLTDYADLKTAGVIKLNPAACPAYMRRCAMDTPVILTVGASNSNATLGEVTIMVAFVVDGRQHEVHPHGIMYNTVTAVPTGNSGQSGNSY